MSCKGRQAANCRKIFISKFIRLKKETTRERARKEKSYGDRKITKPGTDMLQIFSIVWARSIPSGGKIVITHII